jgi:hypothetical protein
VANSSCTVNNFLFFKSVSLFVLHVFIREGSFFRMKIGNERVTMSTFESRELAVVRCLPEGCDDNCAIFSGSQKVLRLDSFELSMRQ